MFNDFNYITNTPGTQGSFLGQIAFLLFQVWNAWTLVRRVSPAGGEGEGSGEKEIYFSFCDKKRASLCGIFRKTARPAARRRLNRRIGMEIA